MICNIVTSMFNNKYSNKFKFAFVFLFYLQINIFAKRDILLGII